MITSNSTASALLSDVQEALRGAGVSQLGDRPGLPHLPEVETWVVGEGVILKVSVAPEERLGAGAIPGRVQDALRSSGLALAEVPDNVVPTSPPPATELASGRAVRVVRRQ